MKLKWISNLFEKEMIGNIVTQPNDLKKSQYSLTPTTLEKQIVIMEDGVEKTIENPTYQSIIDIVSKLNDKEVRNIALTGPFGSGKSSILLTLQKDFPQYQYLPISLATLESLKVESDTNENSKNSETHNNSLNTDTHNNVSEPLNHEEEVLNRKIEYSILQQIIYKEKADDIPQSRFKRIRHISIRNSYLFAIGFILFFLSVSILFEPKILHIPSLYLFFSCSPKWKIFWDLLLSGYIIFSSVYFISKLMIKTYNNRINKLNFKDGEIGIGESASIFNKHLDEIIYFFEVTKYDIVIIEDLDRFDTPAIFLKLRELNCLLNNSKSIKRSAGKIVFIYAIRDDMFKDTSRTKFFDFISTVIPVINPSNSRDKLLNAFREHGIQEISDDVCMDLGIFIDDMRILKNTVNEFIQYRQKLQENLSPKKLLGIILYKNYHPDDFSMLHNQQGIVYNIITNRVKYHNSNVREKNEEIEKHKKDLMQINDYYFNQKGKELRTLYVMKYIEKNPNILNFREGTTFYTPTQIIADDVLFQKLMNNEFAKYYNPNTGTIANLNIKFEEVQDEVDPNLTYIERFNFRPKRVNEILSKIEKLSVEINELRTLPLSQIINKYSADDFYRDCKENKLITYLIKAGYIDENYYDYISYFYPGVLTPNDREFILDLKIGIKKDYNYIIYKPKAVISDLHESLFSRIEILNINLLDFLIENKADYSTQYILLKNNIKKHNTSGFVESYYKSGKHIELFFNDILPIWSQFFTKNILQAKSIEKADTNFEILLKYFPESKIKDYNNSKFINYISDRLDFINQKHDVIPTEKIMFLTKHLGLKYNDLNVETFYSKELWEFIINGNCYLLNKLNIQYIVKTINQESFRKYKLASYSTILDLGNTNIIKYVEKNIEDCISNVFIDTSTEENEEALKLIISNTNIDNKTKIKYLTIQNNKIDLSDIDEEHYDDALNVDIIRPNWQNIAKYISIEQEVEFNSIILDFITKYSYELGQQRISSYVPDPMVLNIFLKLIGDNILPIESYMQIRNSFNLIFISFDFSTLQKERIEYLIETNTIKFNEYNYRLISTHFTILTHKFIIKNKKDFFNKIESYSLNPTSAYLLINSDHLMKNEKIRIIESLSEAILDQDKILSNEICSILNSVKKPLYNKAFVLELLRNGNNQIEKLNLFVRECIETEYKKDFVKSGLKLLGGDYAAISLQRGHRRLFILNKANKLLAEYLVKNNFISKQYEEKGMIKINSRII
ncbi:MAG: hypothetical protein WCZ90_20325 [Melioribacteraceae bacterium]